MKLVKYFLQKKSVTVLLLILVLGGGLFSYIKMGKLEDAPFTIKQALVMTPYPGASPSEVQSQVTDVLEESIQSLGELYYLKTENRAGLSKITVYVKKEIAATASGVVFFIAICADSGIFIAICIISPDSRTAAIADCRVFFQTIRTDDATVPFCIVIIIDNVIAALAN